jgi:hypothetical protein
MLHKGVFIVVFAASQVACLILLYWMHETPRDGTGEGLEIRQCADQTPEALFDEVSTLVDKVDAHVRSVRNVAERAIDNITDRRTAESAAATLEQCSREMEGVRTQLEQAAMIARRANVISVQQQRTMAATRAEVIERKAMLAASTFHDSVAQYRYLARKTRLVASRYADGVVK